MLDHVKMILLCHEIEVIGTYSNHDNLSASANRIPASIVSVLGNDSVTEPVVINSCSRFCSDGVAIMARIVSVTYWHSTISPLKQLVSNLFREMQRGHFTAQRTVAALSLERTALPRRPSLVEMPGHV